MSRFDPQELLLAELEETKSRVHVLEYERDQLEDRLSTAIMLAAVGGRALVALAEILTSDASVIVGNDRHKAESVLTEAENWQPATGPEPRNMGEAIKAMIQRAEGWLRKASERPGVAS
jgi:hypothetical protein